ncbi:MAG: hypothetical protein IH988_01140 [Planctomycetes bacterium]|nr:hypothetical protein [Planctomycetota bacterium]
MPLAFKRIKVYVRLIVLVAVALAVGTLLVKNSSRTVTVWFMGEYEDVKVLWLVLCVGLGSIVVYWLMGTLVGLRRDLRELDRAAKLNKREVEQRALAKKLTEQEQRIDEKVKNAHSDEP